jgi:hypothetical protein
MAKIRYYVTKEKKYSKYTVKFVYNDNPRDPKFEVVVDRLLLFIGNFMF